MKVEVYTDPAVLRSSTMHRSFLEFLQQQQEAGYFQSPGFMELVAPVPGFAPVLFLAVDGNGRVVGSLLGVHQQEGGGLKGFFSRRLLVQGGPVGDASAAEALLGALLAHADGRAIFVEFRNAFDTTPLRPVFMHHGFSFKEHLNMLLPIEGEVEAGRRLSTVRRRQIKSSLAAGASYGPAGSIDDVIAFHGILDELYRTKVRKPLPPVDLFVRMFHAPDTHVFVVRWDGRIIGGCAAPVFGDRTIHYWYVCGDNSIKDVHASVLATWAPIEFAARNGIRQLDFMGAGKPGEAYGVRDFKARFGAVEVAHGRYEKVLNRPLYRIANAGLKVYQGIKAGRPMRS